MDSSDINPEDKTSAFGSARTSEAFAVRVRLKELVPLAIVERGPWKEPPLVLVRADGTTEVRGATHDLDAAARWVLERGTSAEVVAPATLRRQVATQAWRIYNRYACDDVRSRRA